MSTNSKKALRKNYLIYPKFQISLLGMHLLIIGCVIATAMIAVARAYENLRQQGVAIGLSPNHAYFNFLEMHSGMIYRSLWIALAISFGLSCVATLLLSHKLAGPIVRMRKFFAEMGETGKVSELQFRKGDYFADLPETINSALTKVSGRK